MQIVGQCIGFFGAAALILSFQCKNIKYLTYLWTASSVLFVTHYGLLGQWSGMIMESVLLVRNALQSTGKPWVMKKWVMWVLLAVIAALTVIFWVDIFSVFPAIALAVSTVGLWSGKGSVVKRVQLLGTSPAWLTYNIYAHSWAGILCEILDMCSVIFYFFREKREKKA